MITEKRIIKVTLIAILAICFAMICLVNFSAVPGFYEADMYCDYKYAMAVWNHKSLFPDSWAFGNQLNVVCTPVLAAVIYGLSGNMNFSMGTACTLMAVLVLFCYDWMMKPVLQRIETRLAAIVLFLTFTLFGGTATSGRDGWTLFFTMCSYYAGYSITAFLAFGCYLRGLSGSFRNLTPIVILTCVLSFGTGIQSIRQTTVMVAPMFAVEFLRMLLFRKTWSENKIPLWITAVISLSNFLGLIYIRLAGISQNQIFGTIALTPLPELVQALKDCLLYFLILIGSDHPETMLVIWSACIICLGSLLLMMWNLKQDKDVGNFALAFLLGISVLVVIAIDTVTTMDVQPRYFFMIYPLMGFLTAYLYAHGNKWVKRVLIVLLVVFFCSTSLREFPRVCESVVKQKEEESVQISAYLLENGYTTIYALWEHGNDVAIASNGKIDLGYWHDVQETFEGIPYLCDLDVYNADPNHSVYFFRGREAADVGIEKAESQGVTLEFLQHFPESDTYIYKAPLNLMRSIAQ